MANTADSLILWALRRLAVFVLIAGLLVGMRPAQAASGYRLPTAGEIERAKQDYLAAMGTVSDIRQVLTVKVHDPKVVALYPNDPVSGRAVWLFASHTYKRQDSGSWGLYIRRASLTSREPWKFETSEDYPVEQAKPGMSLADYIDWRLRDYQYAPCWPEEPCTIALPEKPPEARPEIKVAVTPGYDLSWAESTPYPLRLRFSTSAGWTIDKVCGIEETAGRPYPVFSSPTRNPCESTGGVPELVVDYTRMELSVLAPGGEPPREITLPMTATATLVSPRGGVIEQKVDWQVGLAGAARIYVLRHGIGEVGQEAWVTLGGGAFGEQVPLRQDTTVFYGDSLWLPLGAAVGIRFLDGTAGMIFAPSDMSIARYEVLIPMGAEEGSFKRVDGASVGDLLAEVPGGAAENAAQDAVLSRLLGKLAGPAGAILDFSEARAAEWGGVRIRMR